MSCGARTCVHGNAGSASEGADTYGGYHVDAAVLASARVDGT